MILLGAILLGLLAVWLALAMVETFRLGIGFRQAFLYVPLKLVYRIGDSQIRAASQGRRAGHLRDLAPVAARPGADAVAAARTDAAHTRRRSRRNRCGWSRGASLPAPSPSTRSTSSSAGGWCGCSRGKGRLAVYLPDNVEPDTKSFRLFRADRAHRRPGRRQDRAGLRFRRALPALLADAARARAAPLVPEALDHRRCAPMTIAELIERSGGSSVTTASNALFDRLAEARLARRGPRPQPVRGGARCRQAGSDRRSRSSRTW